MPSGASASDGRAGKAGEDHGRLGEVGQLVERDDGLLGLGLIVLDLEFDLLAAQAALFVQLLDREITPRVACPPTVATGRSAA